MRKAISASISFNCEFSLRRPLTSVLVAWRLVLPCRRRLPASRNSFDQL